jgi:ABC-type spermidine/putrescine transport system permease subunit I
MVSNPKLVFVALVGPALLLLGSFFLAPFLLIAAISFFTYSPSQIWIPILTLGNYGQLLDYYYLHVTWTTMKVGLFTTCSCLVLGYPLAYFLARTRSRGRDVYFFLLIAPLMVSGVVRTFGWLVLLGRQGVINNFLHRLGMSTGIELLYNVPVVVLGLTELLLPFMVLPLMAAIEKIHPSIEEAARNLGAHRIQVFRRVVLPLSLPGLVSGSLLVYSLAISALITPSLMGGRAVHMLGSVIYDQFLTALNWPLASSVAVVLLALSGMIMFIYIRLVRASERWRQCA